MRGDDRWRIRKEEDRLHRVRSARLGCDRRCFCYGIRGRPRLVLVEPLIVNFLRKEHYSLREKLSFDKTFTDLSNVIAPFMRFDFIFRGLEPNEFSTFDPKIGKIAEYPAHLIFKLKHCSSSRVQMPLTQSCSHEMTRTRFHMQIIACSICHALRWVPTALLLSENKDDFSPFLAREKLQLY